MALSPTLSGCFRDNCKTIRLFDTTGAYAASNVGGWGAPNTTLGQADPVVITVTYPDGTEEEFDVTATVNAATISGGQFDLIDIEVADTDLDLTQFADGVYTIEYSVTDSNTSTEYVYTTKVWNDCQAQCCVDKMLTKLCQAFCGCNAMDKVLEHSLAEAMLYSALCAFGEGQWDKAESLLADVHKICKINGCSC